MKNEVKSIMMKNMEMVNQKLAGEPMVNSERVAFLTSIMRKCWETANDFVDSGLLSVRDAEAIYNPYRKVFEDLIQHP